MPKYAYTSQELYEKYVKLPSAQKVNILFRALDYMEQFNGRSKIDCIILAMGYVLRPGEDDSYRKND